MFLLYFQSNIETLNILYYEVDECKKITSLQFTWILKIDKFTITLMSITEVIYGSGGE